METRSEAARLEALREYRILDTPPQTEFDTLVAVTAELFEVPTALVSLVDENRQWFKARVGLETCETERSVSFCTHAIESSERALVVEDALADERFATNPLVTGTPQIRFYAGAPLVTPGGLAIGTLCIIDQKPRSFTSAQIERLCDLARLVVGQLELQRTGRALSAQAGRLASQGAQLQALNAELDRFVQGAAHDLRAPLRHVTGFGRLLAQAISSRLSEKEAGYLNRILESTRRMDRMLQALYVYAQSAGALELTRVNTQRLLKDVRDDLELQIVETGTTLSIGELPPVWADAAQLQRVLLNLLDNAIKYTAQLTSKPEIFIGAERDRHLWRFEVRDNGPGIASQDVCSLFEPFTRLCVDEQVAGAGMGLALCKRVIERMQGQIWLESKLGEGTTFYFTVPALDPREVGPDQAASQSERATCDAYDI